MALARQTRSAFAALFVISALAVAIAVFDFVWTGNGIHGSLGALIVIGSTALMLIASAAVASGLVNGWLGAVLAVLILLDILGTGFAAYMLEAAAQLAVMGLALIAWLFAAFGGRTTVRVTAAGARR